MASASSPVALVLGASRGIGRAVAHRFAASGYSLSICARTVEPSKQLPGTIGESAALITEQYPHTSVLALGCDVRKEDEVNNVVQRTMDKFGRLDAVVYNAGAIFWDKVANTPLKRFDLMTAVNMRGAYAATQAVLPIMMEQNHGSITYVSPPIYSRFFKGKTAYAMGKIGMSVLCLGLAEDLKGTDIRVNAMWPATAVKSFVTSKMNIPDSYMRDPEIFADACVQLAAMGAEAPQGQTLIDEDFLREYHGFTDADIARYQSDPSSDPPPRMMPVKFPSLEVAEQDEATLPSPVGHAAAASASLTSASDAAGSKTPTSKL